MLVLFSLSYVYLALSGKHCFSHFHTKVFYQIKDSSIPFKVKFTEYIIAKRIINSFTATIFVHLLVSESIEYWFGV